MENLNNNSIYKRESLISIVIPVYNVDQYLSACLSSVLNQSLENIEVLLVDDGSSDGSALICDKYSEKDSRVRVFHKNNGGVSSARQYGLERAQGKWVLFVDADDYCRETLSNACIHGVKMRILFWVILLMNLVR